MADGATPSTWRMVWVVAFLGACFVAIRFARADAQALWLATLRAVIAGAALLGYATWRRKLGPVGLSQWRLIGGLGLANATLAGGTMYLAAARLPTGIASVLANAQPLLIVLPAWLLYRERSHRAALAGLAVGATGLVVVGLPGGGGSGATPCHRSRAQMFAPPPCHSFVCPLDNRQANIGHRVRGRRSLTAGPGGRLQPALTPGR